MANYNMPGGPGHPHMPQGPPMHPQARRQPDYNPYYHQGQPHSPNHHPYAAYPHPAHYYPHPHMQQVPYTPHRWQHPYAMPQPYMPAPPPHQQPPQQQMPYQPRSPMIVTSQPYTQAPMTPAGRQHQAPAPHITQPPATQSPRPIPQNVPSYTHTPVAPPSPAPTPKQEINRDPAQEQANTPPAVQPASPAAVRSESRRQSLATNALQLPAEYRTPQYPSLPWYSRGTAENFPPRARRRRKRRQELHTIGDSLAIPIRGAGGVNAEEFATGKAEEPAHNAHESSLNAQSLRAAFPTPSTVKDLTSDGSPTVVPDQNSDDSQTVVSDPKSDETLVTAIKVSNQSTNDAHLQLQNDHEASEPVQDLAVDDRQSEASSMARPSEPETPATSEAPSDFECAAPSTPITPSRTVVASPKPAAPPAQPQHARRDTRTAIAVPNLPSRPKPSPPTTSDKSLQSPAPQATLAHSTELTKDEKTDQAQPQDGAAEPVAATAKPAPPKSWAELLRSKAPPPSSAGALSSAFTPNGFHIPKSASLGDALRQYSVQSDSTVSFIEPRGLVNTGNMCYMNSILQVLVFCTPFYNFLNQVRLRTVHSMKSDTPLVDSMILFMREFKVLASAESAEQLRKLLNQQQLEQYGDPVVPQYVYDAIAKLERFNGMRRGHQQDAEEFLGFLLEGLHDECVAVMAGSKEEKSSENGATSPSTVMSPGSADGWLEVGPKQKASVTRTAGQGDMPSPITKIFGGHFRSVLRVPGNKDSVMLEPYKPLPLDIGAPHVNNIIDAIKSITHTENLTGDFGGRATGAKKQVFIDTLPPVLILHLKRFQYENNLTGTQKIWKKIGYPLELEIPKEVFPPNARSSMALKGGPPKYRLTSVVYHHGKSAAGGHYTVDVLREDGREWIRIDDTIIRRIRPEDVAEGGAEEDPKILAKALEQHKADQELQKQRNMYSGLDDMDREPEVEKPWNEVNGHAQGHKKGMSVANAQVSTNGTATPVSGAGKRTPTARREGVKDNKVAYILLYERIRA